MWMKPILTVMAMAPQMRTMTFQVILVKILIQMATEQETMPILMMMEMVFLIAMKSTMAPTP